MERQYIAIDLKSYYASVECNERGLDPLTTNNRIMVLSGKASKAELPIGQTA